MALQDQQRSLAHDLPNPDCAVVRSGDPTLDIGTQRHRVDAGRVAFHDVRRLVARFRPGTLFLSLELSPTKTE